MRKASHIVFAAALLVVAAPAPEAGAQAPGGGDGGAEEFDLEDVFGFTEGTDVKDPGAVSLDVGGEWRSGKGAGRYDAGSAEGKLSYGLNERVELGVSLAGAGYRIRDTPGIADRSRFVFDGLGGEAKAALLDRGAAGPVGVSLLADLAWSRTEGTGGAFSDAFSGGLILLADTHLVPETLFTAVNLGLDAERDLDAHETSSTLFASLAAAYRVGGNTTLGVDARVEAAFDDVLGERTGAAAFVGPTFFTGLTDRISLQAGWLAQVDGSGARFNTEDFERHRVTATIEIGF